jgi:hypothetical protein
MNMDDRCMFIAHEIGCAMLDDFLQLPSVSFHTNVCEGVDEGIARHDAMFALTH